jgi:hypothetical protein
MTMAPKPQPAAGGEAVPELDAVADELIADSAGDPRAAVKALIVANAPGARARAGARRGLKRFFAAMACQAAGARRCLSARVNYRTA